jgi:isoleucyl-tRNA synthetase
MDAKRTLYHVLKTTAQLLAPFAPFFAEDLWLKLKIDNDEVSVHLSKWPISTISKENVIDAMEVVRQVCSVANALRKSNNIPIRQPLNYLRYILEVSRSEFSTGFDVLILDELNVKNVIRELSGEHGLLQISSGGVVVQIDPSITPELKLEGDYRELVRMVQDLRKEKGLAPQDAITLTLPETYQEIIDMFGEELKKTVGAKEVVVKGEEIVIKS